MSDLNKNDTRIRTIRKDLGYTQEQFAEIMDMSISAFKRLDNGKTKLSIEKIYLLVERLNLSADYILYGKSKTVDDIWIEVCKMPIEEKVKMFLRLSAHLFRNKELKDILDMTTDHVDEIISDVIEKYDGGKLQ